MPMSWRKPQRTPLPCLPLTYSECRARFMHAARQAGQPVDAHAIPAPGPFDERLTIDVVHLGAAIPRRALLILSGVHGVEGFIGSALQCDLLERFDSTTLPEDMALVLVHSVNPWGMAWSRRQNESNVDLNRNWRRSDMDPIHNDAYDSLHAIVCPDTDTLPSLDELFAAVRACVEEKGSTWTSDGITKGQYRHADGLHYGGERTEASCLSMERILAQHLAGVERLFTLDLHTGHGPRGAVTLLCDQPPGSDQHAFLCALLGTERVEATVDNPDATTALKSGQVANGVGAFLDVPVAHATSAEFGTVSEGKLLAATVLENWVAQHGDRSQPEHAAAVWRYRCCFTPDDPEWEQTAMTSGRELIEASVAAVARWDDHGR